MIFKKYLLVVFALCISTNLSYACTGDGTCTTDCPAPPNIGLLSRPWCSPTETGIISVSSNIGSPVWSISGPASAPGVVPLGMYTITWGFVAGYNTPPSESCMISNDGESCNFLGNYTMNTPSVEIHFSLVSVFNNLFN